MNISNIISQLRDKNGFSQSDLADKSQVSRVMIGKYERGEAIPSIDAAKKIADALGVSLDYLVGSTDVLLEKSIVNRVLDIQKLKESEKQHVFALLDAFIKQTKFQSIM